VTPREGSQRGVESHTFQLSQDDVEKLVEEKVAIAVSRAVRQALNETIPELRQGVVNEVSQRAVEQLSGELREIRQSLRDAVTGELKELSSQWLRRETPSLAKDVIREEIRRVIENI
jgi:actin-like ATPase involved in cell morphogenesis